MDDEREHPQSEKGRQRTKRREDVGVVTARSRDHRAQFGVAESAHSREETRHRPDEQCRPCRSGIDQDAFGSDENARADDAAYDDGDSIQQRDLPPLLLGFNTIIMVYYNNNIFL